MIAYLAGMVLEKEDKALIVDVNGLGLRVAVLSAFGRTVGVGEPVTLRIYHQVSAEAEALYGFATKDDLHYFELLLTVPSVGPRTAMGILEVASGQALVAAVAEEDTTILTRVSGIGRKTAERIIVELKGKLKAPAEGGPRSTLQSEVVDALVSLGYTAVQARQAVQQLPGSVQTVEE